MDQDKGIARLLEEEKDRLRKELRGITAAIAAFSKAYTTERVANNFRLKPVIRIAVAQRARWAKTRKGADKGEPKVVPIASKRTVSAAARKKIAAAQRARWAKVKAGKKTA